MNKFLIMLLLAIAPFSFGNILDYNVAVPMKIVTPKLGSQNIGQTIVVSFFVKTNGKAENVHVKSIANYDTIDKITDAINQWEFVPKVQDGKVVESEVEIKIVVEKDSIKFI